MKENMKNVKIKRISTGDFKGLVDVDFKKELIMKNEEIYRKGEASKSLLKDPLLVKFFKDQEDACQEAFRRLPLDADLRAFQAVHNTLLATLRLKNELKEYVFRYKARLKKERKEEPFLKPKI